MSVHMYAFSKVSLIPLVSLYVVLILSDMIGTVIKEEKHLLNDEEFALLAVFAHLSCTLFHFLLQLILLTWER